jgi:transcription elongation factor GreA
MQDKKFYLTQEGLEKIRKEEEALKQLKVLKANGGSPEAFHSEDLNPEYLAFQEDADFLETRLLELENVLKNYKLIKAPPKAKQDKVNLGAAVLVQQDGQENEYRLVGTLEADPLGHKISNESPIGQALLGKKTGDSVSINNQTYTIKRIRYQEA